MWLQPPSFKFKRKHRARILSAVTPHNTPPTTGSEKTNRKYHVEKVHVMVTSSNEKHFPRYWPFVRGIQQWPVNSPHKGRWRGALMFSLICAWTNDWANNREAGDLRRHRAHHDVTVMVPFCYEQQWQVSWHKYRLTDYDRIRTKWELLYSLLIRLISLIWYYCKLNFSGLFCS